MSGIQSTFAHRETIIVNQIDINRKNKQSICDIVSIIQEAFKQQKLDGIVNTIFFKI